VAPLIFKASSQHHQQQVLARMWGKKEPSYTVGGDVNYYNHSGKKFGGYLKS
jgi:hypothetical protein